MRDSINFLQICMERFFCDEIKIIAGEPFIIGEDRKNFVLGTNNTRKGNIIYLLLEECDICNVLNGHLVGTIKEMMEAEVDKYPG